MELVPGVVVVVEKLAGGSGLAAAATAAGAEDGGRGISCGSELFGRLLERVWGRMAIVGGSGEETAAEDEVAGAAPAAGGSALEAFLVLTEGDDADGK